MEHVHVSEEVHHKRSSRIVEHGLRCAGLFDVSLAHHNNLIGHLERFFLIVCDKHGCHMHLFVELPQPGSQFLSHFGVKGTEGLIEQQHARLYGEGTCQGNALTLATGKLRRISLAEALQSHEVQQFIDSFTYLRFWGIADSHAKCNIFKHRHMAEQSIMLKDKAHFAIARRSFRDVFLLKQDAAFVGCFQAGYDPKQSRLSRARRTKQCGQTFGRNSRLMFFRATKSPNRFDKF